MKTKAIFFLGLSILLTHLAGCTVNEENPTLKNASVFSFAIEMPSDGAATRIGVEQKAGSRDLAFRWQEGDRVQVVLRRGNEFNDLGTVGVTSISEDGKTAHFNVDLRDYYESTRFPFSLFCFTGNDIPGTADAIGGGNWAAVCSYGIKRATLENFKAPMYCRIEVGGKNELKGAFQHVGTYELLHVKNDTDVPMHFSHRGFEVETPWYRGDTRVWFTDDFDCTNLSGEWEGEAESVEALVMPHAERTFVSWYLPSGFKISDARLVASINGERVISSNSFSSQVVIERNHAYHMYATWDGTGLMFRKSLDVQTITARVDSNTMTGTFTGAVTNASTGALKTGFRFWKEGSHPEDYVEFDATSSKEGSFSLELTYKDFAEIANDNSIKGKYYVSAFAIDSKGDRHYGNILEFIIDKEGGTEWRGQITLERKYLVHSGNEYAYHTFSLVFNNGKKLTVGYYDTNYWTSYSNKRHGVYLRMGNQEWYVQPRISDKWVDEKLEVDSDGTVRYYSDGEFLGEHTFMDFGKASEMYLDMDPFGWWTGHYQAMDDFRLTTPFGVIEDNFDKNIFDLNFWERPQNPNGVYVEDGVMKAVQKSTDGDYHLKSKAISLVSSPVTPTYDGRVIVLERKYLVHSGNEYAYHDFSLALDNGQTLSISYYDTDYWTSYDDSKHGVYIHLGNQEWYVQPRKSDEWVKEKLVFTLDGSIFYYCNDELIKGIGMSGFDSEGISSLCVTMNPFGWWTGHYQYMDDFKLVTPSGRIEDNFDKNIFDLNIWEKPENPDGVYVEDGVMKTIQKSTNGDFKLRSKAISLISEPDTPDYDKREIVLERKYLVHKGSEYAYPTISMVFDNKQTLKVGYYDTDYWTSYDDSKHGVYIQFENQEWYVQPRISDEWVNEKIVFSLSGSVRYFCNGELKKEVGLPTLKPEEISSVYINVNPFGWWTGHYQYMDDFYLTAGGRTIRDNFNDGVLDSSIWETPVNPDGVYEADGYVQMHQLRTDQDFTLKSKPLQLPK